MALSMPTLYDRKEYVVDTEPSEASVTFLNKFVVKKKAAAAESTDAQSVRPPSNPGRRPVAAFGRLSSHMCPPSLRPQSRRARLHSCNLWWRMLSYASATTSS